MGAPTGLRAVAREQAAEELFDHRIYRALAQRAPDEENRRLLSELAEHEERHFRYWLEVGGLDPGSVRTSRLRHTVLLATTRLFGLAFIIRWLERGEEEAVRRYRGLLGTGLLDAEQEGRLRQIVDDELGHEHELEQRIGDERTDYLGAAVLGLNDALVELTGGLTGLASSIADPRLIAFSGLVVGFAAALSMAASNFLSVDIGPSEGELRPGRAAAYTGTAYILVVVALVAPFFIADDRIVALATAWTIAVAIIVAFAYYASVLQQSSFAKRLGQMLALGLGVAVVSFALGKAIGAVLGISV